MAVRQNERSSNTSEDQKCHYRSDHDQALALLKSRIFQENFRRQGYGARGRGKPRPACAANNVLFPDVWAVRITYHAATIFTGGTFRHVATRWFYSAARQMPRLNYNIACRKLRRYFVQGLEQQVDVLCGVEMSGAYAHGTIGK